MFVCDDKSILSFVFLFVVLTLVSTPSVSSIPRVLEITLSLFEIAVSSCSMCSATLSGGNLGFGKVSLDPCPSFQFKSCLDRRIKSSVILKSLSLSFRWDDLFVQSVKQLPRTWYLRQGLALHERIGAPPTLCLQ